MMIRIMKRVMLLLVVALLLVPTITVSAKPTDKKEIQVPINKSYKSAKFTITFDYYEDYEVIIYSPEKKEYKGMLVSDNVVQCVVNDVAVGQWCVEIKRPQIEEESTQEEEPVEVREISPVKVQVEGSSENLVDVNKDITVATDIAGLKMYFKDDDFVVEWSDTTCGNVNIEIVNAKNLQKIDKQTVKENSYFCTMPEGVEEIMVTIVPAVSSSVAGAENTYTYKFDNYPNATVTFEDLTITNHDCLIATCQLEEKYAVKIMVNGSQVEYTSILDAGVYDYNIPIEVGMNDVQVYIVDEKGNMRSTKWTVEKDVIAPQLDLMSTYEDIVTQDEYITIEGKVNDFSKLMINNAEVEVEGDNTFKFDYKLKEGLNQIAVIASDDAGNETIYDIAAQRVIPEEKPVPWLKIIICATLLGLVIIYVVEIVKKKNEPNDNASKKKKSKVEEYENVDISQMSQKEKKDILRGPHFIWDIISFAIPLVALYVILTYIIMVSVVQSPSMEPKMPVGNTVIYNRLAYLKSEPQRGDVVVFFSVENQAYFAKRIIGVPGDVIQFRDGYVVINGQFCDESAYISSEIETNCTKEFEVPEGSYFMLGDNREFSKDARHWNDPYVPGEFIKGKYMGQIDFSIQYDILNKIVGTEE